MHLRAVNLHADMDLSVPAGAATDGLMEATSNSGRGGAVCAHRTADAATPRIPLQIVLIW